MNSSKYKIGNIMRGSRKFCQRGSNSDKFFLFCFFEGSEAPQTTMSRQNFGLPAKRHIECWLCSFVIFRRSRLVILENPILCDFHEPQRSYAGEAQTRGPSVLSQALYHCAPFLTLGVGLGAPGYPGVKNYFSNMIM